VLYDKEKVLEAGLVNVFTLYVYWR